MPGRWTGWNHLLALSFLAALGIAVIGNLLFFSVFAIAIIGLVIVTGLSPVFLPRRLGLVLLIFGAFELISISLSIYRPNGSRYLLFAGSAILLILLCHSAWRDPRVRKNVVHLAMWAGVAFALVFMRNVWNLHIQAINAGLPDMMMFRNDSVPFLVDANSWSSFMLSFLPFSVILALGDLRRERVAGLVGLVILLVAVLLCFSRGALLALAAFGIVMLAGLIYFRREVPVRRVLLAGIVSAIALVIVLIPFKPEIWSTLELDATASQERSIDNRITGLNVALQSFYEHPVTGVGSGNYQMAYNVLHEPTFDIPPRIQSGGQLATVLAEKGAIGILFYLAFALLFARQVLYALPKSAEVQGKVFLLAIFSGLVSMLIRDGTLPVITQKGPVLFMFASLAGLALSYTTSSGIQTRTSPAMSRKHFIFLAGISALLVSYYGVNLLGDRLTKSAEKAVINGDLDRSRGSLQTAIRLNPEQAIYWYHMAAAHLIAQGGDDIDVLLNGVDVLDEESYSLVRDNLDRAIALCPYDESLLMSRSMACLQAGLIDSARLFAKEAALRDRRIPVYHVMEALASVRLGDTLSMRHSFAMALSAAPDMWLSRVGDRMVEVDSTVAIRALYDALELLDKEPESPIIQARTGALALFAGDHDRAENDLLEALSGLPGLNRPYYYLGEIALIKGDTMEAINLFEQSAVLDDKDPMPVYRKALLLAGPEAAAEAISGINSQLRPEHFFKRRALYRNRVIPGLIPSAQFERDMEANPEYVGKRISGGG